MNIDLSKEIDGLARQHGGRLTTDILYDAARQKTKHPALWAYCDSRDVWDKDEAQRQHGKRVLSELYRKWRVVITNTKQERLWQPMIVKSPHIPGNQAGMIKTARLKNDPEGMKLVIISYLKKAKGFTNTAQALAKGLDHMDYCDSPIQALDEAIRKFEQLGKRKTT